MRKLFFLLSGCLILFTSACAPVVQERFFWPPPPDEPKVEFIGNYTGSEDIPKKGVAELARSVSGGTGEKLIQPSGVAAGAHGKIFVSDSTSGKVFLFDFEKGSVTSLEFKFKMPFGLAVDSKENLYVVDRGEPIVRVFSPQLDPLFSFGGKDLTEPIRIAVDEERGRIYVSDRKVHQVKVFTLSGELIQSIGGTAPGEIDGYFYRPNGLAIDRAGNLYVCDHLNARVQVFDPSGKFLRKFGTRGDLLNNFEAPMGIAFDRDNRLWIMDLRKGTLLNYDLSGEEPKFLFAVYGAAPAPQAKFNFYGGVAVAIDENNRIYVADALARRLSAWQILDKPYLTQHPLPKNWMDRTDVWDIWYRDGGVAPPKETPAAAPKP
jgi:sugar lactone lactonase YvrE